ncbi:MAG TPA: hypothetical protein VLM20_04515, partial [Methylophilaceae bacterium]|nr:hypothetical protein [Methylophilaceae bacterium]
MDIIDFAKKSKQEQQATKKRLDDLVAHAVIDIPENDRMIVETGHGVVIACSGPLENALEDALFIALTIRDEILSTNTEMVYPLYLLMGINLGSVKIENSVNVNEPPKIIGEGLIEAQRIMSFAKPNQILVSRAYYDMASKLTLEIAQMFEKYDMHAYEHDIYAVRLLNEKAASLDNAEPFAQNIVSEDEEETESNSVNRSNYLLPIILAIIMLFALTKWMTAEKSSDSEVQPASIDKSLDQATPTSEDDTKLDLINDETDNPEASEKTQPRLNEADKTFPTSNPNKTSTKKAIRAPKKESDTDNIVTEEPKVTESKQEVKNKEPAQTTKD